MSVVSKNAVHYPVSINSGKAFIRDLLFWGRQNFDTKEFPAERTSAKYLTLPNPVCLRHPVDPNSFLARRYGESLEGEHTVEQRRDMGRADVFQIQESQLSLGEEFECVAEVLKDCSDVALAEFAKSINDQSAEMQTACGHLPDTLIFSPGAFQEYLTLPVPQASMQTFLHRFGEPIVRKPSYEPSGNSDVAFKGHDALGRELYTYQNYFRTDDGLIQTMLPPGTVILANRTGCMGTRLYGAIEHNDTLVSGARYTTLETLDGQEIAQTTSAPMMRLGWSQAVKAFRLV